MAYTSAVAVEQCHGEAAEHLCHRVLGDGPRRVRFDEALQITIRVELHVQLDSQAARVEGDVRLPLDDVAAAGELAQRRYLAHDGMY